MIVFQSQYKSLAHVLLFAWLTSSTKEVLVKEQHRVGFKD